MEKLLVTKNGLKKLQKELLHLKTIKRKEIASRIEEAKEYGDISENSEYEDAKNEQALIESRILDLESMIKNSKLMIGGRSKNKVNFNSKVRVRVDNKTKIFKIVGLAESDPSKGKISCNSPIGKALLGLEEGELAEIKTPNRVVKYKVLKID